MAFEIVHGHRGHANNARTPTYNSWRGMRERCYYPAHPRYLDYGGRGVLVCDRWRTFTAFLEDMGVRPAGMTLDRVDPNDHYYPANCRWATPVLQRWNRRNIGEACGDVEPVKPPPAGLFTIELAPLDVMPF